MALNDHIERWALQQSVDRLALAVANGQVTLDDLGDIARRKPVFASKFALVQQQLEAMPNPKEQEDFDRIKSDYDSLLRGEEQLTLMQSYLAKWSANSAAADRVRMVKEWYGEIKEDRDFSRLKDRAEADIAAYNQTGKIPSVEIVQALQMYLNEWKCSGTPASDLHLNMVEDWLSQIKNMRAAKMKSDWERLFDSNGKLKSIEELKNFAIEYSSDPSYSGRIDDAYWAWAMSQPDVLAAASDYDTYFHHVGNHSAEIANLQNMSAEWQAVDQSDIFEVIDYLEDHPDSPFKESAKSLMEVLKRDEIDRMLTSPATYSDAKFRRLAGSGACSKEELVEAVGGSEEVYERIMNLPNEPVIEIPNPLDQLFTKGGVGQTDIVFFGMPSSGKTCVLTGLFASERLAADTSDWNGKYANALKKFGECMTAPPRTQTRFVAVISCEIYKKDKKLELKVPFNLVDMAGEDFQNQIVQIDDLENATVSFASMGDGAPEILANSHDKVFFVLVDPTATGQREMIQKDAIRTLISLFENPTNRQIMSRVRGLHFIVTKADTLLDNRQKSACRAVHKILNEATRTKLRNFCRDLGINSSTEQDLDGRPRVFCFSLGKFHPGNIYSGSQRDSETIINVISDYVVAERQETVGRKVRKFFTQPIF